MDKDARKVTLFSITWPILVEVFLYMLLGTVDVLMLGKYSDDAVGAVGVANQVMGLSGILFNVITSGTAIICAQYIGAGRTNKEKNRLVGTAVQINAIAGVLMSVVMYIFAEQLLRFMSLDESLMAYGIGYMKTVGGFIFMQAISSTFTAVLRAHGKTKICMIITIVMNIINVALNYVLIFGIGGIPSLGVEGAAIATVISKIVAFVALGFVMFKTVIREFEIKNLILISKYEMGKILALGIPSAGETISYNLAQIVITKIINSIGKSANIANSYISTITNYNYVFAVAIAQGTAILIGWKVGAGKKEEAYKLCISSFWKGMAVCMAITVACAFGGKYILSFFTSDETIIKLGMIIFVIDILNEAGRVANLVIINALRAAGDVKFPVVVGILSMWGISVLFAYVFGIGLEWGAVGVWFAKGIDEAVRGVVMYIRWKTKKWQKYATAVSEDN